MLASLRDAFPKIQFIVTTHSPQVVSTAPTDSIRVIYEDQVYNAPQGTQGVESSRILKRVFGSIHAHTPPQWQPYLPSIWIWFMQIIGMPPEVFPCGSKLDAHFGNEEPALTEADLYIENKLWSRVRKRISKSLPPNVLTAFKRLEPCRDLGT